MAERVSLRSDVKRNADREKHDKESTRLLHLLREHNIRDCYVNLGARVDEPQNVRSPGRPLSEISMAQFNQEIRMKSR